MIKEKYKHLLLDRKQLKTFVLFSVSFVTTSHSWSQVNELPPWAHLPKVETDLEKFKLLSALRAEFPPLLEGSSDYDFDVLDVLDDQLRLYMKLASLPEYQQAMVDRGPRLTITIESVKTQKVVETKLDPNELGRIKARPQSNSRQAS